MANNAADFVRSETAKAQIYTPTDARNSYELTKLVVRCDLAAAEKVAPTKSKERTRS
jgi:hypothetical protein